MEKESISHTSSFCPCSTHMRAVRAAKRAGSAGRQAGTVRGNANAMLPCSMGSAQQRGASVCARCMAKYVRGMQKATQMCREGSCMLAHCRQCAKAAQACALHKGRWQQEGVVAVCARHNNGLGQRGGSVCRARGTVVAGRQRCGGGEGMIRGCKATKAQAGRQGGGVAGMRVCVRPAKMRCR